MSEPVESQPPKRLFSGYYTKATHDRYARARPRLKRDRRIDRIIVDLKAELPWFKATDRFAARAWAELEFLSRHAYAALITAGVTNQAGESRRLFHDYVRARSVQLMWARELGLTSASRQLVCANSENVAIEQAQNASERIASLEPKNHSLEDTETPLPAFDDEKPHPNSLGESDGE